MWSGCGDLNPGSPVPQPKTSRPDTLSGVPFHGRWPAEMALLRPRHSCSIARDWLAFGTILGPVRRASSPPCAARRLAGNSVQRRPGFAVPALLPCPGEVRPQQAAACSGVRTLEGRCRGPPPGPRCHGVRPGGRTRPVQRPDRRACRAVREGLPVEPLGEAGRGAARVGGAGGHRPGRAAGRPRPPGRGDQRPARRGEPGAEQDHGSEAPGGAARLRLRVPRGAARGRVGPLRAGPLRHRPVGVHRTVHHRAGATGPADRRWGSGATGQAAAG